MNRIVISPAPRLGVGVGMLGFTLWVFAVLLWLCWETAKVLTVVTAIAVAAVVAWFQKVTNKEDTEEG